MVLVAAARQPLVAQCGPLITSFPYSEGFESAPAWTSGGTANDWAWGAPSHPLINSAGGGSKCWCVGGLSGTFYNNNERSWLESPCFDFTSLANPRISFKIFWEVERQYDGMTFQYSTDGGTTYSNVGAFNEPANCNTTYWFNTSSITNLPASITPKHGWSGRQGSTQGSCQGGNGSQGWVTAKHCLSWLAHAPSVRFRFFFGAGSQCNNFDGIAIDDILIDEAQPVVAAFSGDCNGTAVDFINASTPCPDTFAWNFGDPASAQNTSVQENPSHSYSGPGTYTVTLTATDACGATATTTQQISVLGVSIAAVQPTCGQSNGSLTATVTGASGPVNYYWSPVGATTSIISNQGPGDYTVTVTAANSCQATATSTLNASVGNLALTLAHTDLTCAGANDGTATATTSGGTEPLSYTWVPGGETVPQLTGLAAGTYTCTVADGGGCTAQQSVTILEPSPVQLTAGPDTAVCAGASVLLQAAASGGTPGYAFAWSPAGPSVSPQATTVFTVIATDAHGCTSAPATATITVSAAFQASFTVNDTAGCVPLCANFQAAPVGAAAYQWNFGDGGTAALSAPLHCFQQGGVFSVSVTVTDSVGCTAVASIPNLVHATARPVASFVASPPTATIDDPLIHFTNTSQNATDFQWHFGDADDNRSTDASPSFAYSTVDCFTVQLLATNAAGCRDSVAGMVCVEDPYMLFMPNAFTPDGDDINDVLMPISSVRHPKDFKFMVFNRWGQVIYSTTNLYAGWDGGTAPDGIYVWKIWVTDATDVQHEAVGHVALLR
jgi:gliding motility-associated-like protein